VKVADCCDQFSVGTLTFARSIETCVESGFVTVIRMIRNSESFLLFWSCVHVIKLPNPISKLTILKIIILVDS
jgi:hypothetical protein